MEDHEIKLKKALIVSVYLDKADQQMCEEHLTELALLSETYGVEVVKKVPCFIRKYDASTFVTKGKLEELVTCALESASNLVIFDDEISPSQQRNLEKHFNIPVMDRTELILKVFAERARTKEARLQIELARLEYEAPRLKRMWTHLSRQAGTAGAGAYLKGVGEKQIEIDRRIIKNKMSKLHADLKEVEATRETQRAGRMKSPIPIFSIVGYTNAGKSSLLNALTDAGVFVEDKLFATLDTTTRKLKLSNHQEILLIDTVGFIRKLPHLLVAAFKSTLEESVHADILLNIVDTSNPSAEEQVKTTFEVLKELGAKDTPVITVLNKIDLPESAKNVQKLRFLYPRTILLSCQTQEGFDDLEVAMIEELQKIWKRVMMRIPQKDYSIVVELMRAGNLIHQDYDENDVLIEIELPSVLVEKWKKYQVK